MECKIIPDETCSEMFVTDKLCTLCMIKRTYIEVKKLNDIRSGQ